MSPHINVYPPTEENDEHVDENLVPCAHLINGVRFQIIWGHNSSQLSLKIGLGDKL